MINQSTPKVVIDTEKQTIVDELGLSNINTIKFIDTGWDNRVYFVSGADIVYKFPRTKKIGDNYNHEIAIINAIKNHQINIKTPQIVHIGKDNAYYAYKAIKGLLLSEMSSTLDEPTKVKIGSQLGDFLKILHAVKVENTRKKSIDDEISQLQKWSKVALRYIDSKTKKQTYKAILNHVQSTLPNTLRALSKTEGLCHGDFHGGNIIIHNDSIGVIDFGDVAYMDTSKDFIGIEDDVILNAMFLAYGVNDEFMQKVTIRKHIFDYIRLSVNIGKKDWDGADRAVKRIIESFKDYS